MDTFENPDFQRILLRGCEWAATGEVTISDFLIPSEIDLALLGCLSGEFINQTHAGFRVAESGLG